MLMEIFLNIYYNKFSFANLSIVVIFIFASVSKNFWIFLLKITWRSWYYRSLDASWPQLLHY